MADAGGGGQACPPSGPLSGGLAIPTSRGWAIPAHYQMRTLLGQGAYGTVAEVLDHKNQRLVAIKKVREMFHNPTDTKRILREIAIQTRLSHVNIARIYDVMLPEGQGLDDFKELYIVMEICDTDLRHLMSKDITLEMVHLATLMYNLLCGLSYIHSAGVYHRDLKPANCLANQDCTVKICDFGLARAVNAPPAVELLPRTPRGEPDQEVGRPSGPIVAHTERARRTLTDHVVTRFYRAPELILLQRNYTEAIDVWSVGCIWAELLQMLEGTHVEDRCYLFPGSTAYPMSPAKGKERDYMHHTKGEKEQLNVIFNIIGTPSAAEIDVLEREDSKRYLALFEEREGSGLRSRFSDASSIGPLAFDLLERMLKFSAHERITVSEALAHPALVDVRDATRETTAPSQVYLDFDNDDQANPEQPLLVERMLRQHFGEEIRRCTEEAEAEADADGGDAEEPSEQPSA